MVIANEEKLSAEGVQSTWVSILLPFDRVLYTQDIFFTNGKSADYGNIQTSSLNQ